MQSAVSACAQAVAPPPLPLAALWPLCACIAVADEIMSLLLQASRSSAHGVVGLCMAARSRDAQLCILHVRTLAQLAWP
jgi:hypothetical protein